MSGIFLSLSRSSPAAFFRKHLFQLVHIDIKTAAGIYTWTSSFMDQTPQHFLRENAFLGCLMDRFKLSHACHLLRSYFNTSWKKLDSLPNSCYIVPEVVALYHNISKKVWIGLHWNINKFGGDSVKKQSKTKYKVFGRIRECRNDKKMSLFDLAEAVGRSENHIGAIERGERNAVKMIPEIAKALDVRPEYLLELDDFKTEDDVRKASRKKQLQHDVYPEQALYDYFQALGLWGGFEHSDGDIKHKPDVFVISKDGKDLNRVPVEEYYDCVDELFQIAQIKIKKLIGG